MERSDISHMGEFYPERTSNIVQARKVSIEGVAKPKAKRNE